MLFGTDLEAVLWVYWVDVYFGFVNLVHKRF